VFQVVSRRADISLGDGWGETRPRRQIVAIGVPGSIDAEALTQQFDSCLSANGTGATI